MTVFIAVVLFAFGLVLTIKGADIFIKAVAWLADVTGISKAVLGATVVAFSTSAPEFFVSLFATVGGSGDMSLGNIVGSNICNLGVGLAIIAICRPHATSGKLSVWNNVIVLMVTAAVFAFALAGIISIYAAIALMVVFIFFTYMQIRYSKEEKSPRKPTNKKEIILNVSMFAIGIAGVILGASVVVDNAKVLAGAMGISEYIIGLTVVAIGTSLPEIVTTIVAIIKKENAMSVGNLIGSNIFNATLILATMTFITDGIAVSNNTAWLDLPVALAFVLVAVMPTLISKKVYRWQGYVLALLYVAYVAVTCFGLQI